jgi:Tfp pilus assembly protein PilF
MDQKGRSRDLLRRALAINPLHPQALAESARLDLDEDRFQEAEEALQKALKADPSDRINQYLMIQCLERSGKKEAARIQQGRFKALEADLARLEEIVRHELPKNPRSADLYVELGGIFFRHGKPDRARTSYQQALLFDPNHQAAQKALQGLAKE